MKVTAKMLSENGACARRVKHFSELFPSGAEINAKNVEKALAVGLPMVAADNYAFGDYGWAKRVNLFDALREHGIDGNEVGSIILLEFNEIIKREGK